MRMFIINNLRRLKLNDDGVTLVEYGIALSVALGVGAVTLGLLSTDINTALTAAGTAMPE